MSPSASGPWFLRFAVLFGLTGMGLGITMGARHDFTLMPVHSHINLVGWVSLFLAGLFYVVRPAADRWMARLHLWLAVPGVVVLSSGIGGSVTAQPWGPPVAIIGSLIVVTGFVLFTINVFRFGKA